MRVIRQFVFVCLCAILAAPFAFAQVQTGSVTGIVTDTSNAILPGVTVTLSGEKLIGGAQVQATDSSGSYRFDRLPPGTYTVRFELQGFKTVERADIIINAAFIANVSPKLEVGNVSETITVQGESPTVDTKSNLQQTIMTQAVLEGVPTGRDPWSLAKLIPGVQVSTYDVGGTQSFQQSSLSSHGSNTNDVSYNIDGATVNWPGGGGGATMLYYDQGMFEEVNYMTSAIPAEVMVGGVSINMVTKDAGNKWRGDAKYNVTSGCLTAPSDPKAVGARYLPGCLESDNVQQGRDAGVLPPTFLGNPTKRTYDINLAGGGALVQDRLWVNGAVRRWIVDKVVNAKNADGSQALDDNTLKNYSGKGVFSASSNQKFAVSYNWNNKIRGHRRDGTFNAPDIASLVQTNPASSTQAKYTGIRNKLVFESSFSRMKGQTNYFYQSDTPPTAVRIEDATLNIADKAAQRHEEQPNSRLQFDNIVSYSASGFGGDHLLKSGVQFGRLYFESQYDVLNNMYLLYSNGKPTTVREYNTPVTSKNLDRVLGVFVQDSWSVGRRLTLNLGGRYDHNAGVLPDQSAGQRQFVGPQTFPESTPVKQNLFVWRTGASYDPMADGRTAVKASYSRYGLQVGVDRVTNVNPLTNGFQTCPWTDPNGDGIAQASEIQTARCSGFPQLSVRYGKANGFDWPYSDEVTAGVERQLAKDTRVGVMYYYRTNRNQIGLRNTAVPSSAYTPFTVTVPNGPGGTLASPKPMTVTAFNLNPTFNGLQNNVIDNQSYLDTTYKGVEFTAQKRLSHNWQLTAGLTIGKNEGGLNSPLAGDRGQSLGNGNDLNDPNFTLYNKGIVGPDSEVAFRLSGIYHAPWDVIVAGSLIANSGYPYISTFSVTPAVAAAAGVTLTRASQTVMLSQRGDERLDAVKLVDLRLSRAFRLPSSRRIEPQFDIYNLFNSAVADAITTGVGGSYLYPSSILSPRIMKVGIAVNF
jgi:TonB dependent receptor/Carboxypeptidase regulatory-like domain